MTQKPLIRIISGARTSGKTTFCSHIAKALNSHGWDVAGLLSLPVIERGEQIAKDAYEIRSGDRRTLARINFDERETTEVQIGRWVFETEVLAWCNAVFHASIPCDFLIVDELGPLEFNQGQGFLEALTAIDSGQFIACMVVIRPELLPAALERWPTAAIIELTDPSQAERQAHDLAQEVSAGFHPRSR